MSLDAMDWVWNHSKSKGTARLTLLAIADKASGPDCSAYAGTTMLIQRTNASRRAVIDAVDKLLESMELATVDGKKGPKGETRYSLPQAVGHRRGKNPGGADSAPVQILHGCRECTPGGADPAPGGCKNCTGKGADSAPHNADNTDHQEEPKDSSAAGELFLLPTFDGSGREIKDASKKKPDHQLEKFGAFWLVYPKKVSKGDAKKAWIKAIEDGVDPDHMVKGATAYARERANQDPTYTKHPATWLNKGCYDDEPSTQMPQQARNGYAAPQTAPRHMTDEEMANALNFG